MSAITRAFTKEQLIEHMKGRKEFAEECAADSTLHPERREYYELTAESLRIALASLEEEAVGEVVLGEFDDCGCYPDAKVACIVADGQAVWENFKDGTRLYAAPPSLVVIDEREAFNAWNNDENLPIAGVGAKNAAWLAWQARAKLVTPPAPVSVPDDVTAEDCPAFIKYDLTEVDEAWARGFNACRSAMLQGADDPLTHEVKNHSEDKLGMVNRLGDANEKDNFPVIPDGWVVCSERMPEQFKAILAFNEYGEVWSGAYDRYWNFYCDNLLVEHVTHWMPLPAAPQQEAKDV